MGGGGGGGGGGGITFGVIWLTLRIVFTRMPGALPEANGRSCDVFRGLINFLCLLNLFPSMNPSRVHNISGEIRHAGIISNKNRKMSGPQFPVM